MVTLSIAVEQGVTATPAAGRYVHFRGDTVNYCGTILPGFINMVAILDSVPATPTGTIILAESRLVELSAYPDYLARQEITTIVTRIRALIASPDPASEYERFLEWLLGMPDTEEFARRFEIAEFLAIEPGDSLRLRALDDALSGTYFDFDRGAAGIDVRVEGPIPSAAIADNRIAGSAVNLMSASDTLDTKIAFVNGVHRDLSDVRATVLLLQRVVRADSANRFPRASVGLFHNRTFSDQYHGVRDAKGCMGQWSRELPFIGGIASLVHLTSCLGRSSAKGIFDVDLVEALEEYRILVHAADAPPPEDVDRLARRTQYWHGLGLHTIYAAHSQGNMLVALMLDGLRRLETRPLQTGRCTALLGMAPPITRATFAAEFEDNDLQFFRGLTVNGDILEVIGLRTDVHHFETAISDPLNAQVAAMRLTSERRARLMQLNYGTTIHNVRNNYFADPTGIALVRQYLSELYEQCRPVQ